MFKFAVRLSLLAVLLSGASCQTYKHSQSRGSFLKTNDPVWEKWLDTPVDIDISEYPIWTFAKIKGLGFENMPIVLLGQTAQYEIVTYQKENTTRRELLWYLYKRYGLVSDFYMMRGSLVLRIRSQEFIELTE